MSKRFVRLSPYDMKTGCLARRFMVGGCLFKENQWYELDSAWAAKLRDLRQGTSAPYFQIMDAEQYREIVQAELAAAYMRGGISLALHGALQPPKPGAPPKTGPRKSKFAGMTADEADLGTAGVITSDDVTSSDEDGDEGHTGHTDDQGEGGEGEAEAEEVDVDAIRTHKQADELAKRFEVDLGDARTVAEKRDVLARELFTEADG